MASKGVPQSARVMGRRSGSLPRLGLADRNAANYSRLTWIKSRLQPKIKTEAARRLRAAMAAAVQDRAKFLITVLLCSLAVGDGKSQVTMAADKELS